MVFIAIIQPKIHESNRRLLKCFHHVFILSCFHFISENLLNGHNSKKQLHIHKFRSSGTFAFRSSRTFFEKYKMFPEAATHLLKQLHKFSRFLHKMYWSSCTFFLSEAVAQIFQGFYTHLELNILLLKKVMKDIFDGWLKNFLQESNAVMLLDLHKFVESLAPILGIFCNFSIFLLATNLWSGAFGLG